MFTAPTVLPSSETTARQARCLALLTELSPEAGGLLVCSRLSIYYLTGAMAPGLLWLPADGEPLLLVRKGLERARLESPQTRAVPFRSYGDLPGLAAEAGIPLSPVVAVEMGGLNWSMGLSLTKNLAAIRPVAGDRILQEARSVKSAYELEIMRRAGAAHRRAICEVLPERIHPGMSELDIAHRAWEVFFSLGHCGLMRMAALGEEGFLGHVAVGENGNYPSYYNGPLGLMGLHPAAPFMGNAETIWRKGTPLALDLGFCLEGMNTDKTQLFFAGSPGDLPSEAARAQAVCEEIEARTAEALRPGAIPAELYALSLDLAAKAGFAEGFMGLDGNQVAFLGHSIGLNVDERPVLAKGFNAPLKAGMTIAIEPKIGLPGFGMVGTENTWEITDSAPRCLTGPDSLIFMA